VVGSHRLGTVFAAQQLEDHERVLVEREEAIDHRVEGRNQLLFHLLCLEVAVLDRPVLAGDDSG